MPCLRGLPLRASAPGSARGASQSTGRRVEPRHRPDRPAPGREAPVLLSAEPVAGYGTAHPLPAGGNNPSTVDAGADELLGELDQIVEGSRWGHAPLLDRERLHDRALARELDFDSREAELRQARAWAT